MAHGPAVPLGFMELAQEAISIVRTSYPGAMLNTLQGSTSHPGGVTSPRNLDKMLATFHTQTGTATIQGAAEGMGSKFGPIQFKAGIIVGAPSPLNWPSTGPAITAPQADLMIKCLGVNTPYTRLTLTSDDTPSLGPLNKGAGWNHYLFTLLDGTAWVSFKSKNQTSVQIHEAQSSQSEIHIEGGSSQEHFQFSEESRSSEQVETSESVSTSIG
jgi:hypothetical protein